MHPTREDDNVNLNAIVFGHVRLPPGSQRSGWHSKLFYSPHLKSYVRVVQVVFFFFCYFYKTPISFGWTSYTLELSFTRGKRIVRIPTHTRPPSATWYVLRRVPNLSARPLVRLHWPAAAVPVLRRLNGRRRRRAQRQHSFFLAPLPRRAHGRRSWRNQLAANVVSG